MISEIKLKTDQNVNSGEIILCAIVCGNEYQIEDFFVEMNPKNKKDG